MPKLIIPPSAISANSCGRGPASNHPSTPSADIAWKWEGKRTGLGHSPHAITVAPTSAPRVYLQSAIISRAKGSLPAPPLLLLFFQLPPRPRRQLNLFPIASTASTNLGYGQFGQLQFNRRIEAPFEGLLEDIPSAFTRVPPQPVFGFVTTARIYRSAKSASDTGFTYVNASFTAGTLSPGFPWSPRHGRADP